MRAILNEKELVMGVCYYPEHWDESLWEDDLRRMLDTGIKVVRIAEFAWNVVEKSEGVYDYTLFDKFLDLAEKMGMKVIFCTPTATPPAWLSEKYPEILNAAKDGSLYNHGARRHYNYNSPMYNKYSANIVEVYASHYAKHPAIIGWQIDNEINCEMGEFYSKSDDEAFRVFIEERYKDIDKLNEAWGTVFWNQTYNTFDEVHIPRKTINNTVNPHQALDYFRFISYSARKFTYMQSEIIRKYLKSDDFITTNGIFANLDNHNLTKESLDFMCYDSYPNFAYLTDSYNKNDKYKDRHWSKNLADVRSMSENFGIMEQQSGANGWTMWMGAPTPRPGQIDLWTMQSIAHGADFISYFRWRTCTKGTEIYWHGILDYSGRDNRRLLEIKAINDKMKLLNEVAGSKYQAEVAVIRDYDNIWDGQADVWQGRLRWRSEEALFDGLQSTHTPYDYIYMEDGTDVSVLNKYKVIFYPHPAILTEERIKTLTSYVENGGKLIFGARTGFKDINGICVMDKLPGLAAELTGADVYEYTITAPDEDMMKVNWEGTLIDAPVFNDMLVAKGENAEVVGFYADSYYEGTPAIIKNTYGKGEVYYFGGCFALNTVEAFLSKLGVKTPYGDKIKAAEQCEIAVRKKDDKEYFFVLNYKREDVTVEFKEKMTDMITGNELFGEVNLKPYEVIVAKNI